jgi:hypothetical protein
MSLLRARFARARSAWRAVVGLVVVATTLLGVIALFAERYGLIGAVAFCSVALIALLVVLLLPDGTWARLVGADTTVDELGALHEQGVRLRIDVPKLKDVEGIVELTFYETKVEEWIAHVHGCLPPRWRGTFLSNPPGTHFSGSGYSAYYGICNNLDDRLQRLVEIMAVVGAK